MPRVFYAPNPNSLVHQAVERSGGIKALADALKLSQQTVNQWVKKDRISNKYILHVCHIADIPPLDLIAYIERRKRPWFYKNPEKKENLLDVLVQVYNGDLTEGKALSITKLPIQTIRQVMTLWGDRLPLLRDTLHSDLPKEIKAERLGITLRQLNRLIKTYLPDPVRPVLPYKIKRTQAQEKWKKYRTQAVNIVRGTFSVVEAAAHIGLSERQMHRWLAKALHDRFGLLLQTIRPLPKAFRYALAEEIEHDHPEVGASLVQYWLGHRLVQRPMPASPDSWKRMNLKRCLIGLLNGEISLKDLCEAREIDKGHLVPILTRNLADLHVGFEQVASWSVAHQEALAEILNAKREE